MTIETIREYLKNEMTPYTRHDLCQKLGCQPNKLAQTLFERDNEIFSPDLPILEVDSDFVNSEEFMPQTNEEIEEVAQIAMSEKEAKEIVAAYDATYAKATRDFEAALAPLVILKDMLGESYDSHCATVTETLLKAKTVDELVTKRLESVIVHNAPFTFERLNIAKTCSVSAHDKLQVALDLVTNSLEMKNYEDALFAIWTKIEEVYAKNNADLKVQFTNTGIELANTAKVRKNSAKMNGDSEHAPRKSASRVISGLNLHGKFAGINFTLTSDNENWTLTGVDQYNVEKFFATDTNDLSVAKQTPASFLRNNVVQGKTQVSLPQLFGANWKE